MKYCTGILFVVLLISCSKNKELPVLETNTDTLSIMDGNILHIDIWTISPEVELDEYVTHKSNGSKKVSFISDIDTLTFNIKANEIHDFVVHYKNQKAVTRINTSANKEISIDQIEVLDYNNKHVGAMIKNDTIPFILGKDNRIHIKGKINDSDTLNLIYDTGANALAVKSSLIGHKIEMKIDGETLNHGSDGSSMKPISLDNKLQIGDLIWDNVKFTSINYKELPFDAVIGWPAFGNKTVEIDYQNNILVIHKSFNNILKGYTKVETALIRGIPYVLGTITVDNKRHSGWFEYDTGGKGSFYLSKQFASRNIPSYKKMEFIGASGSSGSKGVNFTRNVYKLPKLKLGDLETYLIPIAIANKDPENIDYNDILGNDLLKRFNAIIDFENYQIYMKPNSILHTEYIQY